MLTMQITWMPAGFVAITKGSENLLEPKCECSEQVTGSRLLITDCLQIITDW